MKKNFYLLFSTLFFLSVANAQSSRSIESINSNFVQIIQFGAAGKVWASTPGFGCAVYDPAGPSWTSFDRNTAPIFESDTVTAITLYSINAVPHSFMGTTAGVYYRHGINWDTLTSLPDINITGLTKATDGHLYVATQSGISVYDADSLYHIADLNTGNSGLPFNNITSLNFKPVQANGFYAATADSGYFYTNDLVNYTKVNTTTWNLVDNHVNCLNIKSDTSKQLVGTKGGLSVCTFGSCTNFTTGNGLPQNDVTAVDLDVKGNIWVGTRDSGIAVYDGTSFTYIKQGPVLPSNKVRTINCNAGGQCWVGLEDAGIAVIDTGGLLLLQEFTGIKNVAANETGVSIFPQPANDRVQFAISNIINNGDISLFDINGRAMLTQCVTGASHFSVNTQKLEPGLYFYSIRDKGVVVNAGKVAVVR